MDRGVSTVVDVALALLLLSVAVGMLFMAVSGGDTGPDTEHTANHMTTSMGTATDNVTYSVHPEPSETAFDVEELDDEQFSRVSHGTYAELLTWATMANVEVDGADVSTHGDDFAYQVEGSTRNALTAASMDTDYRVQVVVTWVPYENASIQNEQTFGRLPPSDADVTVGQLRTDSGVDPVDPDEVNDWDDLYETTAENIVRGLFPESDLHSALLSTPAEQIAAVHHLYGFGEAVGVERDDLESHVAAQEEDFEVDQAQELLIENTTETLENDDLESEYNSPEEAAEAIRTETVRIFFRLWTTE